MSTLLNQFEHFCQTQVAPMADQLDKDPAQLATLFKKFSAQGYNKLLIPTACGGLEVDNLTYRKFRILIARYSGALTLLQAQHQTVIEHLARINNTFSQQLMKDVVVKNRSFGFFNLQDTNNISIKNASSSLSLYLSCQLPWVSGFNMFSDICLLFTHEGYDHYAIIPFQSLSNGQSHITCSVPVKITVFYGTNTVSIALKNWEIMQENLLRASDNRMLKTSKPHNSVYSFAGITQAALHEAAQSQNLNRPAMRATYEALNHRLDSYTNDLLKESTQGPIALRARGYRLATQATEFARLACGSRALLVSHPVGRLSQEIWQYAITGKSPAQIDAYLADQS